MIPRSAPRDEKPAAWRCPPPPRFRAIAETSISSWLERSEMRRVGPVLARRLADQRDHLRALDRAQVVDDAFGERLLGAHLGEVVPQQVRDDEPAAVEQLRSSSARASSFSFANCTVS